VRGDAGALHDRPIEPVARVEVLEIERPTVVLGSTQSMDLVNTARAAELGFAVVRRRSGGGVVVLTPHDHVWIDVTVPRGHVLWDDDVERATWWLGEAWCEVLRGELPGGVPDWLDDGRVCAAGGAWSVHRGRLVANAPERSVCFACVGPGEVVSGARKVVGIAQRRTKDAARFQCTVFHTIDVGLYGQLLNAPIPTALGQAAGVGERLDAVAVVAAAVLRTRLLAN